MKTVQMYLRESDRERLLDSIAYEKLCNTELLLEYKDKTVAEIQDAVKKRMNGLIDYLLSLEVVPSDHDVLYLTEATSYDKQYNNESHALHLINLEEIRKDIYATSYAFELSDWSETLGYLVADNKLTQDYMTELLTQYLHEITFCGTDPEARKERVRNIFESMKEIEEGQTVSADDMFEELSREYGFPIDEKDPKQDDLHSNVIEAEVRYSRYCNWRERSRILESLGEKPPAFVENV